MDNLFTLLSLDREALTNYTLQSREVENNLEAGRILNRAARRLKDIENRMTSDGRKPEFSQKSVEEVIAKIKNHAPGKKLEWDIKELRILSYNLSQLLNFSPHFEHAINLLDEHWRDLFVNGLAFFLLNSWNTSPLPLRHLAYQLLKKHLITYSGGIRRYLCLKQSIDLFDMPGPKRLSALLVATSTTLEDAPAKLGLKGSALSFPYFSDVIIDYVRKLTMSNYDYVEDLFRNKHTLDRTKKLFFAHAIEDADRKADVSLQTTISRVARRVMGDINDAGIWAPFTGATPEERVLLKKAKDLVTAWYARKSVEAFFDRCVQDPRRRKCWLEYVQNVSDFRIVGSTTTKLKLQGDANVAPLLRTHFIETNSRVATTAALVLFIGNKVFVEFSDVGSLYIYNSSHRLIRNIRGRKTLESTGDLKSPDMAIAVDKVNEWSYICLDEGKLTHRGEWEIRFRRWMREKLGIKPGERLSDEQPTAYMDTGNLFSDNEPLQSSIKATEDNALPEPRDRVTPQGSLFKDEEMSAGSNITTPYPGSRIKATISGIQSKWVFNESVRIIADSKYVYIFIKKSARTYYLCPNPLNKIKKCNIWMAAVYNSDKIFDVKLACQDSEYTVVPTRYTLGKLVWREPDIIFTPLNNKNIVIHTQ